MDSQLKRMNFTLHLNTIEVKVDTAITDFSGFAEQYGTNYKLLKFLNPWLRKPYLTPKQGRSIL